MGFVITFMRTKVQKDFLKIRLKKRYGKRLGENSIIIADTQRPKKAQFIEKIGSYFPDSRAYQIIPEKANYWIEKGAHFTGRVGDLLARKGMVDTKYKSRLQLVEIQDINRNISRVPKEPSMVLINARSGRM